MARRPDSDAIGSVACPMAGCDQTALVFRTNRRGNHLMARCPECGPLQSTSKAAQAHFAKALDRSEPSETVPAKPSRTVKKDEGPEDYDPGEILDEPDTTTQKQHRSPFGLLLLVLAVGGGLMTLKG